MRRRKLLASAGSAGILGLSGCLDVLPGDDDPNNNETDEADETDNNDESDSEQTSYPSRFDYLFPTKSLNEKDGRVSIQIKYNSIDDEFTNPYEGPFQGFDEESVTLHTRSGINSARVVLENEFNDHTGKDDILKEIGINNGSSSIKTVRNYTISDGFIICECDINESTIRNSWNFSEESSSGAAETYNLFKGESNEFIAVGSNWFIVHLNDINKSDFVDSVNEFSSVMSGDIVSENMYDVSDIKRSKKDSLADITIGEYNTDLSFIEDSFGVGANTIICSAYISDSEIETVTVIKFDQGIDSSTIEDNVDSNINDLTVSVDDKIAVIEGNWK